MSLLTLCRDKNEELIVAGDNKMTACFNILASWLCFQAKLEEKHPEVIDDMLKYIDSTNVIIMTACHLEYGDEVFECIMDIIDDLIKADEKAEATQ